MSKTLHYVFDPLCGWCYGASATVSAVSRQPGIQLRLLPSGLFSGKGARSMDEGFASYAWANDQRIERLTGQAFSERYRSGVLADHQQVFDSGPATLALTAVQRARYVDGLDITRVDTLATVLGGLGLQEAAARLTTPDAELLQGNRARVEQAQALLQTFGARGVPAFILEEDGRRELLHASSLYSDPQAFVDQFATA
jgi:putative protein-disulfide isomerase